MTERLDERLSRVMALASEEAVRVHHEYLGTEHILLGVLRDFTVHAAETFKELARCASQLFLR